MPLLEWPHWLVGTVNGLLIPATSMGVSFFILKLPAGLFNGPSFTSQQLQRKISFYENLLFVKRWKSLLPDGSLFFKNSFSKQRLEGKKSEYFIRFRQECYRGEVAHLLMMIAVCVLCPWYNPTWAIVVMILAALGFNLPCYLVQRYNRFRLLRKASLHE